MTRWARSKQVTAAEACRRHAITETTLARWREQALDGIVKGLEGREVGTRREAELEREIAALERKLGLGMLSPAKFERQWCTEGQLEARIAFR